jgi:hypothetical protein
MVESQGDVAPEPVCPYANSVLLMPSITALSALRATRSNTCQHVALPRRRQRGETTHPDVACTSHLQLAYTLHTQLMMMVWGLALVSELVPEHRLSLASLCVGLKTP